ncbi:MAG: F0F1 ATP synthase subunit B [Bacteroidales bacterium]|nr:F0F1 ATP synthase subunit B [Bacteroidales bacterium]
MELFTPESGLIFWMLIVFLTVLFVLWKFAWPSITKAIANREKYINDSVKAADEAFSKLETIKEERNAILTKAREEQNAQFKEVQVLKEKLIEDAKNEARAEADKLIADARKSILAEKEQALKEVRNQVALLSIGIAGRVLRKNLESDKSQMELVDQILDEMDTQKN